MRRDIDEGVAKLATARAGTFTRREVADLGGDRQLVGRRLRTAHWIDHGGGVLALRGHADDFTQRRWVGLLTARAGAAHLTHEAAAELHALTAVLRGLVVVAVEPAVHLERPGVTYHQVGDVLAHHRTEVDGYPTTTVARTIVDLAGALSHRRLGDALEDAVVRRLTTSTGVARVLADVRRQGKPGVRKLVDVLAERDGPATPGSHLEVLLHEAARVAGVRAVAQAPLPSRGLLTGLVDLAVVESKLILEGDGRRWHAREQEMARDRQRDREAARLGWLTLLFVHDDLVTTSPAAPTTSAPPTAPASPLPLPRPVLGCERVAIRPAPTSKPIASG